MQGLTTIQEMMIRGELPKRYTLTENDVGKWLGDGHGLVHPEDVGLTVLVEWNGDGFELLA